MIFGPKRLPMLGRQLGGGLREFKDSITSRGGGDDDKPAEEGRGAAEAALGRPDGEGTVVDGEVVAERDR